MKKTIELGFLDQLQLEVLEGVNTKHRAFKLTSEFSYGCELLGEIITVPSGYRTDFASVPRFFWRILPPHDTYAHAAVIHDYLCDLRGTTGIDSKTTHLIFREAMEVLHVPKWKKATMFRAVKWFGPKFKAN